MEGCPERSAGIAHPNPPLSWVAKVKTSGGHVEWLGVDGESSGPGGVEGPEVHRVAVGVADGHGNVTE